MTRKKPREDWIARDLPVVAELKQCRRLAKDHWQGVDVDGTVLDIIEAEEGLSPAIERVCRQRVCFQAPINRFRQIAATR